MTNLKKFLAEAAEIEAKATKDWIGPCTIYDTFYNYHTISVSGKDGISQSDWSSIPYFRNEFPRMLESLRVLYEAVVAIEDLSPLHERERRTLAREAIAKVDELFGREG